MLENKIQKLVVKHLEKNDWEKIDLKNLNDIKKNFKKIIEERNIDNLNKLNKSELSDREFDRLLSIIEHNTSFSDFAELFLDDDQSIKMDSGENIYLNIFDKKKWCSNIFQVAEEVSNNGQRHDLLLFINGLPICNIELKNNGVAIRNAFEQTKKYSRDLKSLMKFIQLFIISNEDETRYFANNENMNDKFVFKYTSKDNKPINGIFKFIENFLNTCTFSKYIAKYMINKRDSQTLVALRGYQVHGAEAALEHLKSSNKNGYLWHATGSGKTITSFKVAQIVAKDMNQFEKVIFLVDRKDLDSQTMKEYNSFLPSHNKIEETRDSRKLLKQLMTKSNKDKLIISTIQKFSMLFKSEDIEVKKKMETLKDMGIVFIIDECHRSQFGIMNASIRDHFKNIRYIGFTGTPIFDNDKERGMVTADIFHQNLHMYLMQNAIEDKNVLPFQVYFYNHDEKKNIKDIHNYITSKSYVKNVIDEIIFQFNRRSVERKYSSLIVLSDINALIDFYDKFEEIQNTKMENPNYKPLNIGATFSFNEGYSEELTMRRAALKRIISNFNKITNSNEDVDNISNYQNRLQYIIKEESGDPKINIVLVVDQLLTGFDAKKINSVYLLKNLQKHSLIQAMSRTNRILEVGKEVGKIVSFVPGMKSNIDEAVKKYSDSDNAESFMETKYDTFIEDAAETYKELTNINIQELLKHPELNKVKAKEFIKKVSKLSECFRMARTIEKYNDDLIGDTFNLEQLNKLISHSKKIKQIYEETEEWADLSKKGLPNIFDEIESPVYLDSVIEINSEYIRIQLDKAIGHLEKGDLESSREEIEDIKSKLENMGDNELLIEVLDELLEKFNGNNKIHITKSLREIFNHKADAFKDDYNLEEEDITEQLYHFKLKERYSSEIIENWIERRYGMNDLNFPDRIDFIEKKTKVIKNNLKLFIAREEILGD